MSYEELCNITNGRVEEMDEAIRLLTARDAGKAFFHKAQELYKQIGKTGDMNIFEQLSKHLCKVTGYCI